MPACLQPKYSTQKQKPKTGKTQQVINEMGSYKLNILGISEKRWTENGRTTSGKTTILF